MSRRVEQLILSRALKYMCTYYRAFNCRKWFIGAMNTFTLAKGIRMTPDAVFGAIRHIWSDICKPRITSILTD